jgi:AcrR family transcriptional regulator
VAKEAFTWSGANTSLDDIATQTGAGAGTLYRHFPTRDALLQAVYRTEVERLAAAERKFVQTMPPVEAQRAWMLLFVDYIETGAEYARGKSLEGVWKLPALRSQERFMHW